MRLLIALLDREAARAVGARMEWEGWQVRVARGGAQAEALLRREVYDVAALHMCLPERGGLEVLDGLAARPPACPPRVLMLYEPELCAARPAWADCVAPLCAAPARICALLRILAKKPLPKLAAAWGDTPARTADAFLRTLGMDTRLKGRAYAAWLIERLALSPLLRGEAMGLLYQACARAHSTTPAAVERCLRVAVESVFTQGSLRGIERCFGDTVDPDRGKPTNRAFLMQGAQLLHERLTHSFAITGSANSSEMHHSPAAPTRV